MFEYKKKLNDAKLIVAYIGMNSCAFVRSVLNH